MQTNDAEASVVELKQAVWPLLTAVSGSVWLPVYVS